MRAFAHIRSSEARPLRLAVLAALAAVGGHVAADPPEVASVSVPFHNGANLDLFHVFWPTLQVKIAASQLGYTATTTITKWRFFDEEANTFSAEMYEDLIWTPELPRGVPDNIGGWEKYGIPPGYTGWVVLDFEEWGPIAQSEDYTEEETAARIQDYIDLAETTRALRPGVKISLFGFGPTLHEEPGRSYVLQILEHCDGISPSMYLRLHENFDNLSQRLTEKRADIEACLELKEEMDLAVLPFVRKRWTPQPPIYDDGGRKIRYVMPESMARQLILTVFAPNANGTRIDGYVVYERDNVKIAQGWESCIPDTPTQDLVDATDMAFVSQIVTVTGAEQPEPQAQPDVEAVILFD